MCFNQPVLAGVNPLQLAIQNVSRILKMKRYHIAVIKNKKQKKTKTKTNKKQTKKTTTKKNKNKTNKTKNKQTTKTTNKQTKNNNNRLCNPVEEGIK